MNREEAVQEITKVLVDNDVAIGPGGKDFYMLTLEGNLARDLSEEILDAIGEFIGE